jgi:glucosaminylphosphatidylinositol acyltransferase
MAERTLKQEKEAFVANLPGGPISEINSVTVVALVFSIVCFLALLLMIQSAYALWAALQTRTRAADVRRYGFAAFILDVALNSFGLLFSITTYSSHSILLNLLLLTPTVYFYFQPPYTPTVGEKTRAAKANGTKSPKEGNIASIANHNPWVTAYRGGMMVITCLAILAVDFKVFPRRFAKAETWGTSLVASSHEWTDGRWI